MILLVLLILLVTCSGPRDQDVVPDCEASLWFEDRDGDGFGVITSTRESCEVPPGFSSVSGDCDDFDPSVSPGRPDQCNGIDDDCDDAIDEDGSAVAWHRDVDGDGFGAGAASTSCAMPADAVFDDSDCDDADPAIFPGADEHCDGVDEDCSGIADDFPVDGIESFADADGDGYGDESVLTIGCLGTGPDAGGDCDDADAGVHPGAAETCNGTDDDCNGVLDDGPGLASEPFWPDGDLDGYGDAQATPVDACAPPAGFVADDTDCDDSSATTHPGAPELCNLEDDDCDGTHLDENVDDDQDGWSVCGGDCDDTRANVNPDAVELCDALDNDCSGVTNDPWRDAWEPNDDIDDAPRVADDDEIATLQPTISGPDDAADWFEMDTFDDPDPLFEDDFRAWARIDSIPPGVELTLRLYRNNVFAEPVLVDTDSSWQDGVLSVENTGVWGSNDGNLHFVEVEVLNGAWSCTESYLLSMGNND
ncbi:MAG: putative metal-binding motif-containing protein [Alphaproteobacteria bacterium]|nr:putative metal-binding motif-containing protein [Alphaproteobacteria bacterium]